MNPEEGPDVLCKFFDCKDVVYNQEYCHYHWEGGVFGSGESYEQYQIIEQDFIDFIKVVPLEEKHLDSVTSPVLRDIIIRTCVQVEIFFKEWAKKECSDRKDSPPPPMRSYGIDPAPLMEKYNERYKKGELKGELKKERNWTIRDYFCFNYDFDARSSIHVLSLKKDILPFEGWTEQKDSLWWWANYNHIKHGGHDSQKRATLKCAMHALAGLFLMHCKNHQSKRYLQKFNLDNIDYNGIRVTISSNDITTPIDSKKYLFKANGSTYHSQNELVTQKQLQEYANRKQRL